MITRERVAGACLVVLRPVRTTTGRWVIPSEQTDAVLKRLGFRDIRDVLHDPDAEAASQWITEYASRLLAAVTARDEGET